MITPEITEHTVAILPVEDRTVIANESGSGTCVTIGGRFFVATVAHVVPRVSTLRTSGPAPLYAVVSERETNFIHPLFDGGLRGGGQRDDEDLAWLELTANHAKSLERRFLPLHRFRTFCDGRDESLIVAGAPVVYSKRDHKERTLQLGGSWWTTRALHERHDLGGRPLKDRLYLKWPSKVMGDDQFFYSQPDAPGISGGGVWAANRVDTDATWTPASMQLVGIEYAWTHSGVPERFLHAFQIQLWLQMVAEDVPALRSEIAPFIAAGQFGGR